MNRNPTISTVLGANVPTASERYSSYMVLTMGVGVPLMALDFDVSGLKEQYPLNPQPLCR